MTTEGAARGLLRHVPDDDDADVFVEVKAGRFIAALGLPTRMSLARDE